MANRDDHRGFGGDRWRPENRQPGDNRGREGRSFGDEGRFNSDQARYGGGARGGEGEPWRRDRYGARFDQDRTGYGSGYDRQSGGYGRGQGGGYGGQEYGVEGGHRQSGQGQHGRSQGGNERETWRPQGAAPYGDLEFNARASGVEEFGAPHDYAYHPPQGHEFDHDYVHWREEQLKAHDRDYQEWRRHQHQQYDEEYTKFRTERRDTFGKNFHEWRSQRNTSGGMTQQHITAETGDYARRQAHGFGQGDDRPSGSLESPAAMTSSPALQQGGTGGSSGGHSGAGQSGQTGHAASGGSEFGREPTQVQAVTDGSDGRRPDANGAGDEGRTDPNRH
ncbi:hypothetical protein [Phenylobacterium sp.]|jgi:hypothetical protein|uniref:hypothetical protein n=1 Tax=Phenylobacterium sp. TaxID=1871053 RepID=UPI002F9264E3